MPTEMNFDATKVAPSTGRPDPVPVGDYTLMVTESEVAATKKGDGRILKLTYTVVAPEQYKGRKVFANLNIVNPSAEAQKIAQGELSALCHATNVLQLKNSSQLHNIAFKAKLGIEQDPGYPPKNNVTKYIGVDGATPIASAPSAPAAAAAPSTNAPAWAKAKSA